MRAWRGRSLAALGLAWATSGCVGIVPDDIGIADEGSDDAAGETEGEAGGETGMNEGTTGDGEDEQGEGTDGSTEEGMGTEEGTTTSGEETTGTGADDMDSGPQEDTTGGEMGQCEALAGDELDVGPNAIDIGDADILDNECSEPSPDAVFSFFPEADTAYSFSLDAEFTGAMVLADENCWLLEEDQCGSADLAIEAGPFDTSPIFVILEGAAASSATLTIEPL
ncbi:hypothetical protein PPSIR1_35747 [Plesiocystis pacifica SIR-1]|uniref:Lipoprotein n=1 Tax=Plesiocystis pacifica SIR-1 TaxID=391625 RepID=A6G1S8_9BACT|nr:hypothetical protein [Plesiocystis pacifica]EDM80118.1 hypothetical protein PPSIR1_35747 [Plesiocystis pacifica SIR-1]